MERIDHQIFDSASEEDVYLEKIGTLHDVDQIFETCTSTLPGVDPLFDDLERICWNVERTGLLPMAHLGVSFQYYVKPAKYGA